jgi:ferredoxin
VEKEALKEYAVHKLERFFWIKVMVKENRKSSIQPIPQINAQRCIGCGICVRVCPTQALEIQDELARVTHPDQCQYTGLCELVCPTQAISRPFEIVFQRDN